MNRNKLESLLRESNAEFNERTPFCPDEQGIAAYVDGTLVDSERDLVERHLLECQACVDRVGLLANLVDSLHGADEQRLASKRKPAARHWAIAASILVAFGLTSWVYLQPLQPDVDTSNALRQTRNASGAVIAPKLLAPSSIVIEAGDEFTFRWTEVPGSLYYDVRIVSDLGNLVDERRTKTTEWRLDHSLNLEPGRDYFIQVDAYQTDFRPVSSDHLLFRLRQ